MMFAASPIVFEENRGQASHEVLFLSRAAGYGVFLTGNRTVIATNDAKVVQIRLAGAKEVKPVGVDRLPAKSNYFIGSDPARWQTGIFNYARVRYADVYPGIDVLWHGRDGQIEHDFTVGPGADPRRIRFSIRGASLELSTEGDLIAGNVRLHKPHAYQDGREVACRYELRGRTVRFSLGEYDHSRAVTIDPVLSFSTLLGGAYALERRHRPVARVAESHRTCPHQISGDDRSTGTTLPQTATKLWPVQSQVVAQNVEQRGVSSGVHFPSLAVHRDTMGHYSSIQAHAPNGSRRLALVIPRAYRPACNGLALRIGTHCPVW